MLPLSTVTLLVNGLTLALALGFLLIILWYDARKEVNQFFAVFLFLVTMWNAGSLLLEAALVLDPEVPWLRFAMSIIEIGFTGSSVAVYALTTVLVGAHTGRFRFLAFAGLGVIITYQMLLIVNSNNGQSTALNRRFTEVTALFYSTFDAVTVFLLWRFRRKIRVYGIIVGIGLFVAGQTLSFLNPELSVAAFSTNLSAIGAMVLSFGILRQEIIIPLTERAAQVEDMHRVTLSITSQIALDTVLDEITVQAAKWLGADAAGIYLNTGHQLELAAVYNLPNQFLHSVVESGTGVTGTVATTQQSIYLENYSRDWPGAEDLPLARETFGSVVCIPLCYANDVLGVLLVVAGQQGRLFRNEDVYLLELLGSQAAVAIAHSQLFSEQRTLTQQVEFALDQLETVLTSTENPMIAVNRDFRLMFANPAARTLFEIPDSASDKLITEIIPVSAMPEMNRHVLRDLRRNNVYVYEVAFKERIYLCHLAMLKKPRMAGWVAVLNDVTQLKELDRLKSEMVRWASHDLKNPLTGALLYVDLLAEDLEQIDDPEIHQSLAIVEKQLERMNRIIRGILDLEHLKHGSLPTELCQPERLLTAAVDDFIELARDKGVTIRIEAEEGIPCFLGDQNQMERAVSNLIENAIKFTPSGGEITIRAFTESGVIKVLVQDTGIGIPPHLQGQIFDRFFRGGQNGQRGAEHVSGSGLGLSLVKSIVETHKGHIEVTSKEGKGSIFTISLPIADLEL